MIFEVGPLGSLTLDFQVLADRLGVVGSSLDRGRNLESLLRLAAHELRAILLGGMIQFVGFDLYCA
jgi:hypothetical protein